MAMIDPKYADLPGIAYDQADVYETADPENEGIQDYIQEDESVEKIYVNASEAFEKFKDKKVDSTDTNFSDAQSNNKTILGYNVSCRSFGVFRKEDEDLLEKYQRLKIEITELKNEVSSIKDSVKDTEKAKSIADVMSLIEKTGEELEAIDVNKFINKDFLSSVLDCQDFHFKELQTSIELFKQNSTRKLAVKDREGSLSKDSSTGALKYQMIYFPEKAIIQEQMRIASLEKRIGYIESIIGTSNNTGAKNDQIIKSHGIVKTVEEMVSKVSLLNSNNLDVLENKITSLLSKLDTAIQKTANQNTEYEKKLSELYQLVKQVENFSEVLPKAVDRMLSLSDVHHKAAEVTTDLKHLDNLQSNITKTLDANTSLLGEVQKNFGQNLEVLMKDVTSLSERLKKLKV